MLINPFNYDSFSRGVIIGSENGVGDFIINGYSLPPIMISEEEANALVISDKLILNQGDPL
ncbi:hypothetical protein [Pseudotamlana agarivorans]|uniref:hypothetical protein n=1 Tax=Pseudotamlana agarivorans TaxID=481183 RepID=UPI00083175EE|nr:hypothetical protein [Tamlana agarivorans]